MSLAKSQVKKLSVMSSSYEKRNRRIRKDWHLKKLGKIPPFLSFSSNLSNLAQEEADAKELKDIKNIGLTAK